jgi:6-phosphogluconolactonase (cycloisomerase 2 family)
MDEEDHPPTEHDGGTMNARMERIAAAGLLAALCTASAAGQASDAMLFVANNGNLEGSVSSLRIEPDGTLTVVDVLVTGTGDEAGTNAQSIDLTPDGRFLATGHGTGNEVVEQLTIISVAADGTLSTHGVFQTPDSPLDLKWLRNNVLAVTRTSLSVTNEVIVYAFDPDVPSLTQIDSDATGSFNTDLTVDREHGLLYGQDSFGFTVSSFRVEAGGTLTHVQTIGTGGVYPLGVGVSPDGGMLYAGGGISSGGNKIIGFNVNTATGTMAAMPASPFTSPGASPKQVAVSADGQFAIAAHGTDATFRSFSINAETGALTSTGFSFDVGLQGSLSEVAASGDLVFALDNTTAIDGVRGAYSFTLNPNGSFTQNGPLLDTGGISPWRMAVWSPALCTADVTGDGVVNVLDLIELLLCFGLPAVLGCEPADVNADGFVNVLDLIELLLEFGQACP